MDFNLNKIRAMGRAPAGLYIRAARRGIYTLFTTILRAVLVYSWFHVSANICVCSPLQRCIHPCLGYIWMFSYIIQIKLCPHTSYKGGTGKIHEIFFSNCGFSMKMFGSFFLWRESVLVSCLTSPGSASAKSLGDKVFRYTYNTTFSYPYQTFSMQTTIHSQSTLHKLTIMNTRV